MLKSKMIYDPTKDEGRSRPWGNAMGLTVGITFHTPKYSKCKPEAALVSQFDEMWYPDPLKEETLERRFIYWWYHTHRCNKKRHRNYLGYMYWTGPKRRYTFFYQGRDGIRKYQGAKWWQIFQVSKHNRYVRWFDNGPKSPYVHKPLTADERKAFEPHQRRFSEALASSRQQMHEYIRIRSADGGRG